MLHVYCNPAISILADPHWVTDPVAKSFKAVGRYMNTVVGPLMIT